MSEESVGPKRRGRRSRRTADQPAVAPTQPNDAEAPAEGAVGDRTGVPDAESAGVGAGGGDLQMAETEARAEADALTADDDIPREEVGPNGRPAAEASAREGDGIRFGPREVAAGPIGLPILDDARSPNPATCPFLRSEGVDGRLGFPVETPDERNRCAAFGEPRGQSLRQQSVACLTAEHVTCPRYLRGSAVAREAVLAATPRRGVTRAMLAAVVVLVVSASASFGFVLVRGGLALPAGVGPEPTDVAAATLGPTVAPSSPTAVPDTPAPTARPTATPAPTPTPTPQPTPTPTATPTPTPAPTPTPRPTSNRYALLTPCPNRPDCYIYRIRSGDNIYSIARYFGVPEATVRQLNPWLATTPLRAGQQLILPPPTR